MRGLLAVELGLGLVVALVFLALYGSPRRSADPPMAWHIAAFTYSVAALIALLLASLLGWDVPLPLGALVLASLDGVLGWRLWLLLKARR